jgi:ABC transporter
VPRAQRAERAESALKLLHVDDLADRMADTLSGGEARRVHLARALALGSDCLLLDEPFAGLDPPTRAELLQDAAAALRHPDRATLVIVHDRAEAWALADRLIVLLDGKVAADGTPASVLERPPTLDVAEFLGFSGRVRDDDGGLRCVRPALVALDPDGPLEGTVRRRTPEEDGVLCDIVLEDGQLQLRTIYPGPQIGDLVRVRVDGSVRYVDGRLAADPPASRRRSPAAAPDAPAASEPAGDDAAEEDRGGPADGGGRLWSAPGSED